MIQLISGVSTAQDCADECQCVENNGSVTYRGFAHKTKINAIDVCDCLVDSAPVAVLNAVNNQCNADANAAGAGTGEIQGIDTQIDFNCYKVKGGKAGKQKPKAGKRG